MKSPLPVWIPFQKPFRFLFGNNKGILHQFPPVPDVVLAWNIPLEKNPTASFACTKGVPGFLHELTIKQALSRVGSLPGFVQAITIYARMMAGRTIRSTGTRRPEGLAAALAVSTILFGCSGLGSPPAPQLVSFGLAANPQPAAFDVCRSYGCTETSHVVLSDAEWAKVQAMFKPPPADAREERARAARAVGLLEELVGPKAGTQYDAPRNEPGPPGTAQLDCLAKASNTTVFLLLLEREKLLHHHRVDHPAHRGFLVFFPHNTAVLVERENGRAWAIDSWYRPNGSPAAVWPMELWRARKENEGNRENRGSD